MKLKPCPWCGGVENLLPSDNVHRYVRCNHVGCKADGPMIRTEYSNNPIDGKELASLDKLWNRRAKTAIPISELSEQVAAALLGGNRPCPFCGDANIRDQSGSYISCKNPKCEADGPYAKHDQTALQAWNKRT